jgi:hypothetical protein
VVRIRQSHIHTIVGRSLHGESSSEAALKIIKSVVSVCVSTLGFTVDDATINFFANQLDIAATLAKEGADISPPQLSAALASKAFSLASLTRSEELKCGAAIGVFGINTVQFAITCAGAVLSGGALGYAAYVDGYAALNALYCTSKECAPIANRFQKKMTEGTMWLNYNIEKLVLSGHL